MGRVAGPRRPAAYLSRTGGGMLKAGYSFALGLSNSIAATAGLSPRAHRHSCRRGGGRALTARCGPQPSRRAASPDVTRIQPYRSTALPLDWRQAPLAHNAPKVLPILCIYYIVIKLPILFKPMPFWQNVKLASRRGSRCRQKTSAQIHVENRVATNRLGPYFDHLIRTLKSYTELRKEKTSSVGTVRRDIDWVHSTNTTTLNILKRSTLLFLFSS